MRRARRIGCPDSQLDDLRLERQHRLVGGQAPLEETLFEQRQVQLDFRVVDIVSNAGFFDANFRDGNMFYTGIEAGGREIRVFLSSTNPSIASQVVWDSTLNLTAATNYTLIQAGFARTGQTPARTAWVLTDNPAAPGAGLIGLRVVNAGAGMGSVDVNVTRHATDTLPDTPLLSGVVYGTTSGRGAAAVSDPRHRVKYKSRGMQPSGRAGIHDRPPPPAEGGVACTGDDTRRCRDPGTGREGGDAAPRRSVAAEALYPDAPSRGRRGPFPDRDARRAQRPDSRLTRARPPDESRYRTGEPARVRRDAGSLGGLFAGPCGRGRCRLVGDGTMELP